MHMSPGNKLGNFADSRMTVKARVSPGLFFINLGGKQLYARTSLDLKPGESYDAKVKQLAGSVFLNISSNRNVSISSVIDSYRLESNVELDALSVLLMNRMVMLQQRFEPAGFRKMYLQFQYVMSRVFNFKSISGKPFQALPPAAFSVLRSIMVLNAKNLQPSDSQLLSFVRLLGRQSPDAPAEAAQPWSRQELELMALFNASQGEEKNAEARWLLVPLSDDRHPEKKILMRYNMAAGNNMVSCSLDSWYFHWDDAAREIMYYYKPEAKHAADDDKIGVIGSETTLKKGLLAFLKPLKFNKVEYLIELQDFDGFSLTESTNDISIVEVYNG